MAAEYDAGYVCSVLSTQCSNLARPAQRVVLPDLRPLEGWMGEIDRPVE